MRLWDAGQFGNITEFVCCRSADIFKPRSILFFSLVKIPIPRPILLQSLLRLFPHVFPLVMEVRDILAEQTMLFGVLAGPRPSLLVEGLDDAVLFWSWLLLLEFEAGAAVIVLRKHHVFKYKI